jgi:hypothetical protein
MVLRRESEFAAFFVCGNPIGMFSLFSLRIHMARARWALASCTEP